MENTGNEGRKKGARGLVFLLTTHQEEISLWPNCVSFVLKLKAILQYEITPTSPIISGEHNPPPPLGSLLLVQKQKFNWVAKDNKAVTLDWGRESVVFLCHPFMLRTINMKTLPACYMKYRVENRNRETFLSQYLHRYSNTTPFWKTHVAGEYTNTHTASALMMRQANT